MARRKGGQAAAQERAQPPPNHLTKENAEERRAIVYSAAETSEQEQLIENALLQPGHSVATIVRAMQQRWPRFGIGRYKKLAARVHSRWKDEDDQARDKRRAQQIRRLERALAYAWGDKRRVPDPANPGQTIEQVVRPTDLKAVATFEKLLADVCGTRAPVEVNVHHVVTETLVQVIAQMTPEQVADALAEHREMKRLAQERKQAILTEGKEVA